MKRQLYFRCLLYLEVSEQYTVPRYRQFRKLAFMAESSAKKEYLMRAYTVEQTSLSLKWTFHRMLPSLPGPGTPGFADLCKGLHPYGLLPAAVTVDSPTTRLGDLYIGIVLLDNGRLTLRLSCSGLELFLKELFIGDEEILVQIVDLVFVALSSIDSEA